MRSVLSSQFAPSPNTIPPVSSVREFAPDTLGKNLGNWRWNNPRDNTREPYCWRRHDHAGCRPPTHRARGRRVRRSHRCDNRQPLAIDPTSASPRPFHPASTWTTLRIGMLPRSRSKSVGRYGRVTHLGDTKNRRTSRGNTRCATQSTKLGLNPSVRTRVVTARGVSRGSQRWT